ncbi:hypothetical protein GO495_17065 [Chitinophaga oryziterrae]|uniref:DUF4595 domain-containing protein n=1 Tax=Chitinophaga oryziterrae TaxID=1031224 RepID=A0A6N8JAJ3_9BACT|nr:hypothetical protein [Chitinophaga oryziterrae]MVT42305.1 hypothetical protein [Chitinophaga oryziterrae]
MNGLLNKGTLGATFLMAAAMLSGFRTVNGKMHLHGITTATDKTVITYNADKSIAKLVSTHKTSDESYVVARIPVYENGRLVKTLFTDGDESDAPVLFSTFTYSSKGLVEKINYYEDNVVNAYDSLVYNNTGKITARYFFSKQEGKNGFESHNCQLYTWNAQGNISSMENMGRLNDKAEFVLSSGISYKYDSKPNAQQSIPVLSYIIDVTPANLSANNIISETITAVAGNAIVNNYAYTYNASQYPVKVTATYDGGKETVATELEWAE